MNLKIYTQDLGAYGAIVVVAKDEATAREIMQRNNVPQFSGYESTLEVEEHEITEGLWIDFMGDR